MKATAEALKELAWLATRCRDATELRAEALAWVDRMIAVDAAIFVELDGNEPSARSAIGLDERWVDGFLAGLRTNYRSDYDQIMASLSAGRFMSGPTTRLEHWAALPNRCGLEEDLMFPLGLRIGGGGLVVTRGAPSAVLLLAREGRARIFTGEEGEVMESAAPILALGLTLHRREVVQPAPPAPPAPSPKPTAASRGPLTPRERSVVEYVALGLSTREIGLAMGTSPNTVRNQIASIFRKLSVASRAELVAVAIAEGIVSPG
jgi:DNA-binding CsgD family transcriptional regulator